MPGARAGAGTRKGGAWVGHSEPEEARALCCRCVGARRRRASPLTCLAICFLVLTYNLLGGFLFLALEGGGQSATEAGRAPAGGDLRARTVERLWAITEDLNILYKENWTKLAARELVDFQRALAEALRGGTSDDFRPRTSNESRWTFSASFLYALTLITTIGHGELAPASPAGKAVAVAYACIGIPIIMLYLSTVGEALGRGCRSLYARLRPVRPHAAPAAAAAVAGGKGGAGDVGTSRTPFQAALNLEGAQGGIAGGLHWPCGAHARVPLPLSVLPVALYVLAGALLFQRTERWSILDGCYFSFSSLATVGFGELRPGRYASSVSPHAEDLAIGACCLYILVGIALVATCFNLAREDLATALRGLGARCGPARPVDPALPRRRPGGGEEHFARQSNTRRSAPPADRCREYFVPRSLSEFDLASAGAGTAAGAGRGARDKTVTFEEGGGGRALPDDVFIDDVGGGAGDVSLQETPDFISDGGYRTASLDAYVTDFVYTKV
ncbi:TWiK family of potassium channels protein 18 [Eumeta japonica]|uniref:TWiK family of potassium channels protein 18 n=1 Tax=Eumeta variegata TaxID=151549 RepID=A0A4C1TXL6_EUMVA|nr:TWiK family of potassium channels protein 18 [Eumeta japonica]